MGYYFLPDAIASVNDQENEEDRHRVKNEARETEDLQEAGRDAVLSGDLEAILALSPKEFEYTMAAILRMLRMTDIKRVGGRGHLGVDITARDASGCTVLVQCKRRGRGNFGAQRNSRGFVREKTRLSNSGLSIVFA
jgi:hypothetical protein